MKKLIVAATILAIAGVGIQTAKAGDKEWATAGKILTGVIAGAVIANVVSTEPVTYSASYSYGANSYIYCPPPPPRVIVAPAPVMCAPSPVIVYRTPGCASPQPVVSVTLGQHHRHHAKRPDYDDRHRGYQHHGKRDHRK